MLNFKQLHHFWTVARAGGIVRGSERSGLAPQTLSGQIAALEASLGVSLFRRQRRRLVLTDNGRMVLDYAEEIFRLGNELEDAVRSRSVDRFSKTMRVLARREPVSRRDARLVVSPGRAPSTPIVTTKHTSTRAPAA